MHALQIPSKTPTALPLEYFDSPDMEVSDYPAVLEAARAAGAQGLEAHSRFYDPSGAFTWAPCTALEYDRCGTRRQRGAIMPSICVARHVVQAKLHARGAAQCMAPDDS